MDERERPLASASSRATDGHRTLWKTIWGCPTPPKVRVFAWWLVSTSLATWANKFSRNLEPNDLCPLWNARMVTTLCADARRLRTCGRGCMQQVAGMAIRRVG
uniref:Reverse transcriptase zinc-binding domain-containing protein n=1 Tax=Aegilops tauschii subsp. strangulata TaxID=200361 RepID=A0A453K394_AEGTS